MDKDYLIKFNEVDSNGDVFLPDSISIDSLNKLKISGHIVDYEIDNKGIKVIKEFKLNSVSI